MYPIQVGEGFKLFESVRWVGKDKVEPFAAALYVSEYIAADRQAFIGLGNEKLEGLATVLFLKPDRIVFKRENNGVYSPYPVSYTHLDVYKRQYKYYGP